MLATRPTSRKTWTLVILAKIKLLAWRATDKAIPSKLALAKWILRLCCRRNICGECEKFDRHALFDCMLAREVWKRSKFDTRFWDTLGSVLEIFVNAKTMLGEEWGEFIAIV